MIATEEKIYLLIVPLFIAIVFLATLLFYLYRLVKDYKKNADTEKQQQQKNISLPIRLRAYERLTLLLNRIDPKNIVPRVIKETHTAQALREKLTSSIQDEYNHNASQQIYISEILWEELTDAQQNLHELIAASYSKCQPNDDPKLLAKAILDAYYSQEQSFIDVAQLSINSEVKDLL